MNYEELKGISKEEAIQMTQPEGWEIDKRVMSQFPEFADVIVFGDEYWRTNEGIARFIEKFIDPKNEGEISKFFNEIVFNICTDPALDQTALRNNIAPNYKLMYSSYLKLFRHPDSLGDWADSKATFIWLEFIVAKKRKEKFLNIVKPMDKAKLSEISAKIQKVYGFSDLEILYLQYFCSQSKLDDLDASLNTTLYIWSQEKMTGKTTVSEYICSYLNGEEGKNADAHKSQLEREMKLGRFDMPVAITSRCTILDEAGFHDMTKTYDKFKTMITSNSCEVEYKYKNSKRPKRCYRNYIMSSNNDPIYFIKDESERRILPIHFKTPERLSFEKLAKIWHEFVLECNYSASTLEIMYATEIKPNSQDGESKHVMQELLDIFSRERINNLNAENNSFNVTNVMTFPEILSQKMTRKLVKEVLIKLYGEPDSSQRFYKSNRIRRSDFEEIEELNGVFEKEKESNELPF